MNYQTGILEEVSDYAVFLEWNIADTAALQQAMAYLSDAVSGSRHVVGIGIPLMKALGLKNPELESFPDYSTADIHIPSTQNALLVIVRSDVQTEAINVAGDLDSGLGPGFRLISRTGAFKHEGGRDLTGYEDGTENPTGEDAVDAAIVQGQGEHIDGSAFVAVQRWLHDFTVFNSMTSVQQDDIIGRHKETNEEFDAPSFAHVKRTAQESFEPEAFVVRRSMPWSDARGSGLMFVAYGSSFQAFDVQMKKMTGSMDGIADGLFRFTRPVTGSYYWCPPSDRLVPSCWD